MLADRRRASTFIAPAARVLLGATMLFALASAGQPRGSDPGHDVSWPARRLNRITLSPLSFFLLAAGAEYERAAGFKSSWYLGSHFSFATPLSRQLLGIDAPALELTAGARFFPLPGDLAPHGLWVGPEARVGYGRLSTGVEGATPLALGLHATVGYTFIAGDCVARPPPGAFLCAENGFTVSVGAAGGAATPSMASPLTRLRLSVGAHANVGYAF